jgi:predicted CXXCH cytochrome family protein
MKPAAFIAVLLASAGAWAVAQPQSADPANIRPADRTPNCTIGGCHAKEMNHKFQHGPTAVSACDACHQYADASAHTFKLRAQGRDLCTFCHINKQGSEGPFSHKPFADGECIKCHDPHGAEVRFNLRKPDVNSLCLSCHEKVLAGHPSVHQAVTEKNCTGCHKPHTAEHTKLLVKEPRDLCLSCHQDVQHQIDTGTVAHEPLKLDGKNKGDCLACHTPHASDTTHQLKAPPAQLCGECHKDVAQTAMSASNPHAAVVDGEACLNCHKPHGSEHAKLMRDEPVATCLACHKEPPKAALAKKEADNPSRPTFAAPEPDPTKGTPLKPTKPAAGVPELSAKGLNPHGPVAEGKCAACHDVHGGMQAKLLKASLSTDVYESYSAQHYALCFTCHNDKLAEAKTTQTDTNFRDGDRNLHFLHVNKEQGRTCVACHTVHASKFGQQIRESVQYGNWQLPINYKPSETGGSCAPGCHREQTYSRTAVKIPVKELQGSKTGAAPAGGSPE